MLLSRQIELILMRNTKIIVLKNKLSNNSSNQNYNKTQTTYTNEKHLKNKNKIK